MREEELKSVLITGDVSAISAIIITDPNISESTLVSDVFAKSVNTNQANSFIRCKGVLANVSQCFEKKNVPHSLLINVVKDEYSHFDMDLIYKKFLKDPMSDESIMFSLFHFTINCIIKTTMDDILHKSCKHCLEDAVIRKLYITNYLSKLSDDDKYLLNSAVIYAPTTNEVFVNRCINIEVNKLRLDLLDFLIKEDFMDDKNMERLLHLTCLIK